MEVASVAWWSSGRSGCVLRLCGGFWRPQKWRSVLSGAQSAQEAGLDTSLWLDWIQGYPGQEGRGMVSPEETRWRGETLKETATRFIIISSIYLLQVSFLFNHSHFLFWTIICWTRHVELFAMNNQAGSRSSNLILLLVQTLAQPV